MAHFAEIGIDNIVLRVVVIHNNELLDSNGQESEAKGAKFCQDLFGGTWVQTSYNATIRKNYAAEGFKYDSQRNAFIAPQPYPSWTLDEITCRWCAPVPYPTNTGTAENPKRYNWDEASRTWLPIEP